MKNIIKEFLLDPVSLRRDVRRAMQEDFKHYMKKDMVVYDIGCGDKPFQSVVEEHARKYIGVDIEKGFYDSSHIDLIGTAYDVPIEQGSADAVISCQVLEHLERPLDAIKEKSRILRKDGILFLSFPFMYPIHAAPVDFFRYTEFTAQKILSDNGFEILKLSRISGFWYALGLFSGIYIKILDRGILKKLKISTALKTAIQLVFFLFDWIEEKLFRALGKDVELMRRDWTINYIITARKI